MSAVQFCVRLEEEPHRQIPLSPDSLLHLRQSLEQSLWTLVEDLQLSVDSNTGESLVGPFLRFPVATQLFGALLMRLIFGICCEAVAIN